MGGAGGGREMVRCEGDVRRTVGNGWSEETDYICGYVDCWFADYGGVIVVVV